MTTDNEAMKCPYCKKEIPDELIAGALGSKTSEKKKVSSRENGKLGGRPPKKKPAE